MTKKVGTAQVEMPILCLSCQRLWTFDFNSPQAQGTLLVFCNAECEDRYTARREEVERHRRAAGGEGGQWDAPAS